LVRWIFQPSALTPEVRINRDNTGTVEHRIEAPTGVSIQCQGASLKATQRRNIDIAGAG